MTSPTTTARTWGCGEEDNVSQLLVRAAENEATHRKFLLELVAVDRAPSSAGQQLIKGGSLSSRGHGRRRLLVGSARARVSCACCAAVLGVARCRTRRRRARVVGWRLAGEARRGAGAGGRPLWAGAGWQGWSYSWRVRLELRSRGERAVRSRGSTRLRLADLLSLANEGSTSPSRAALALADLAQRQCSNAHEYNTRKKEGDAQSHSLIKPSHDDVTTLDCEHERRRPSRPRTTTRRRGRRREKEGGDAPSRAAARRG